MPQLQATRLYIPPRARLETVWRIQDAWQVWTMCPDRNAPFDQMIGTFLQLNADGSAVRVTLRTDGTIDEHEVMPK